MWPSFVEAASRIPALRPLVPEHTRSWPEQGRASHFLTHPATRSRATSRVKREDEEETEEKEEGKEEENTQGRKGGKDAVRCNVNHKHLFLLPFLSFFSAMPHCYVIPVSLPKIQAASRTHSLNNSLRKPASSCKKA